MMGFSVTLSHIIMVISSVCLASAFSAYAFYSGNLVQNELAQNVNDYKRIVNMQLEIVYATIDNSTTPSHFFTALFSLSSPLSFSYNSSWVLQSWAST